jgi:CheY-like chemotaxis protein
MSPCALKHSQSIADDHGSRARRLVPGDNTVAQIPVRRVSDATERPAPRRFAWLPGLALVVCVLFRASAAVAGTSAQDPSVQARTAAAADAAGSPGWIRVLEILLFSAAGAAAVRLYDVRHQRRLESLVAERAEQLTAEIAERRRAAVELQAARNMIRRRLRVLVADDNAINRMVTERMLRRAGHTVALAENGLQAMEMALARRFDLVLMDVQMPEMDGFAAAVAIRRAEVSTCRTPIVGLTAQAFRGDRDRCLDAGMDDYVAKPVRRQELEAAMARVLRRDSSSTLTSEEPSATAQRA